MLGGTAHVVRFRQHGSVQNGVSTNVLSILADVLPPLSPLDAAEFGLTCHIPCQRQSRPNTRMDTAAIWYPEAGKRRREFEEALQKIDDYNKLISDGPNHEPGTSSHGAYEAELYSQFLAADNLANTKIGHNRGVFRAIFIFAALQAACLETYSEFWPHWPPLFFYLLCLGVIVGLVWRLRRHETHQRAIDYRALAEGLRVQRYWRIGGLPDMVAHHYLRRHAGSMRWVRVALQGCVIQPLRAEPAFDHVLKHWIEDQSDYFGNSSVRRGRLTHRLRHVATWAFRSGIAVAVAALVMVAFGVMPNEGTNARSALLLAMALLPTFAGLIAGYLETAAYQEDVREHGRLHTLFSLAARQFRASPKQRPAIIKDLGKEALDESASWALLHKTHEPEIPSG